MKRLIFSCLFTLSSTLLSANEIPVAQTKSQMVEFQNIFNTAPLIYTLLAALSVASLAICLYSLATFRAKEIAPKALSLELRSLLQSQQYDQAKILCENQGKLLGAIIAAGISTRNLGPQIVLDSMRSEGKRASTTFWQRLSLLNDIVIAAPMIGLLGTVTGMFYAFYDVNRTTESINALYDGLGISVGTTVAGLIVAILSMAFYTILKYRLVKAFNELENQAFALSPLIHTNKE